VEFTDKERENIQLFLDTMTFYLRRDIDKSQGEDKYAFWQSEFTNMARRNGAWLDYYSESIAADPTQELFDYLKYCMSFPEELLAKLASLADSFRGDLANPPARPAGAGSVRMVRASASLSGPMSDNVELNERDYAYEIFGQEGEDGLLRRWFENKQEPGFYVDVGAHHPFRSPTPTASTSRLERPEHRGQSRCAGAVRALSSARPEPAVASSPRRMVSSTSTSYSARVPTHG
jgi:hypothetical protein